MPRWPTYTDRVPRRPPPNTCKLTLDHVQIARASGRAGHTLEQLAHVSGVSLRTVSAWLAKGRAGEARYSGFSRAYDDALSFWLKRQEREREREADAFERAAQET